MSGSGLRGRARRRSDFAQSDIKGFSKSTSFSKFDESQPPPIQTLENSYQKVKLINFFLGNHLFIKTNLLQLTILLRDIQILKQHQVINFFHRQLNWQA
jgi:hypothetical protein